MDGEKAIETESRLNKSIICALKVFGFYPTKDDVTDLKYDLSLSESTDSEITVGEIYRKMEAQLPLRLMPFRHYAEPELDTVYLYVVCEVMRQQGLHYPRQKIQKLAFYAKQLDQEQGFEDIDDSVNCAIEKMVSNHWSCPRGFPLRLVQDEIIAVSDLSETESYESSEDESIMRKTIDSHDDDLVQGVIDFVNHKSCLRDSI